jgi:hypothetical protein
MTLGFSLQRRDSELLTRRSRNQKGLLTRLHLRAGRVYFGWAGIWGCCQEWR